MAEQFFEKLKQIKGFVFDVDGVLTDGMLLLLGDGEWLRNMNIKDGFAIKHAVDNRYKICVISGSDSEAITYRMQALGVEDIFTRAVRNKKATDIKKALAMTIEKGFHPNILAYKAYTDTVPKPCDPNER